MLTFSQTLAGLGILALVVLMIAVGIAAIEYREHGSHQG